MKKSLILSVIISVSLLSCSKQTTLDDNSYTGSAVSFKTAVGKSTKGTDITAEALKLQGSTIAVFTYKGTNGYPGSSGGVTPNDYAVMANYRMTYDTPSSRWIVVNGAGDEVQLYWPGMGSGERLSFYAYFPYSDGTVGNPITNITPTTVGTGVLTPASFDFTVPNSVASQIDLLTARNEPPAPTATVLLPFVHALSKVTLMAKTDVANWEVTVQNVTISEVNNQGKYTFATYKAPSDPNSTWSNISGNASYTMPLNNAAGVTFKATDTPNSADYIDVSSTAAGQSMFLMPQELSMNGNDPKLTIIYSVKNTSTGTIIIDNATIDIFIGNADSAVGGTLNTKWTRGYIINYKLIFQERLPGTPGSLINFSVDVNGWSNQDNPFN